MKLTDNTPEQSPETPDMPSEQKKETPQPTPPAETPAVETRPSWFKRTLAALFDPDTRLGKVMRPLVRWMAAVVGLFALGLLVGYLLLYRPTQAQLETARAALTQSQQQAQEAKTAREAAQQDLANLQTDFQTLQKGLAQSTGHTGLLKVLNSVTSARLALANKDGAAAQKALKQADADLQKLKPALEQQDKELADSLSARLALTLNELNRDPKTAASDLEILTTTLLQAEEKYFPSK